MRIFVSSTIVDLVEYRRAAKDAIVRAGHEPYLVEEQLVSVVSKPIQDVINDAVNSCDVMVTILGHRLGAIAPGMDAPLTFLETQLARATGKPVFVYVTRDFTTPAGTEVRSKYVASIAESKILQVVTSTADLAQRIARDLSSLLDETGFQSETATIILPTVQPKDFKRLLTHPEELQRVSSRDFEELIAELLSADGWEVNVIARHNAPGPDIIAVTSKFIQGVPLKLIVECKRYSEQNPVDINVVRKVMYWVNEEYRATMGMIATTGRFTSDAIEQAKEYHQWRLDLKDQSEIIKWLQRRHGNLIT